MEFVRDKLVRLQCYYEKKETHQFKDYRTLDEDFQLRLRGTYPLELARQPMLSCTQRLLQLFLSSTATIRSGRSTADAGHPQGLGPAPLDRVLTLFLQIEQQDLVQEVATVSGQFRQNLEELVEGIIQNRGNILWGLFLIIVVVLLAKISLKVVSWATGHTLKSPKYQSDTAAAKRMRTLMTLLRSVARYIIYFIALLIVLSILGMGEPLSNLLITAGVGSLASALARRAWSRTSSRECS